MTNYIPYTESDFLNLFFKKSMYSILEAMFLFVNSKRRKAAYNHFFVQTLKLNFRIFYSSLTWKKIILLFLKSLLRVNPKSLIIQFFHWVWTDEKIFLFSLASLNYHRFFVLLKKNLFFWLSCELTFLSLPRTCPKILKNTGRPLACRHNMHLNRKKAFFCEAENCGRSATDERKASQHFWSKDFFVGFEMRVRLFYS